MRWLQKQLGSEENQTDFRVDQLASDYKSFTDFKRRYRIEERLGYGGQAQVFNAIDLETNELVALKIY